VKGGVEAGDGGQLRRERRDGIERGQALGLVQGRQLDELAQGALRVGIDPHRLAEALAPVHDAVADRVRLAQGAVERAAQLLGVHRSTGRLQRARFDRRVALVEQRELEAAGACVDDEDAHRFGYPGMSAAGATSLAPGQRHCVMAGGSSPRSRV
jgi:hypothetical protein